MAGDLLTFALLAFSSLIVIVNPLAATVLFVTLTTNMDTSRKIRIARESSRFALVILLIFAILGGVIFQLFNITLEAFRIAGGILLFVIGMEMVYARTSRTKVTATEQSEGMETEDISIMPLATPMISGPGAITTVIVLMNETAGNVVEFAMVIAAIFTAIGITWLMIRNADRIVKRLGQREVRVINRLMGMLLIAIAVQFVILGLKQAFPILSQGT
jgi:multiple antibiotic resistance protein